MHASLRGCQNLLFLAAHEILVRGDFTLEELVPFAEDGPDGNARLHELSRRGELSHPFPVTFGTHIEVIDPSLPSLTFCEDLVDRVMTATETGTLAANHALVDGTTATPWYLFENQSFVFLPASDGANGVYDPDRVRLLEFATLRRGALRSIQRDTQRVLTGGSDVSRRRIDEWRLLLATTTDDYVLHDRISSLLVPMAQHLRSNSAARDPERLELQVRANINSFQARVERASQSVSTILGALFAVVAAVVGLGSLAKAIVAAQLDLSASELAEGHTWISSGIDFAVTVCRVRRDVAGDPSFKRTRTRSPSLFRPSAAAKVAWCTTGE